MLMFAELIRTCVTHFCVIGSSLETEDALHQGIAMLAKKRKSTQLVNDILSTHLYSKYFWQVTSCYE